MAPTAPFTDVLGVSARNSSLGFKIYGIKKIIPRPVPKQGFRQGLQVAGLRPLVAGLDHSTANQNVAIYSAQLPKTTAKFGRWNFVAIEI